MNLLKILPILLVFQSTLVHATKDDPWFTEPLFAIPGKSLPLGTSGLSLYGYYIPNDGIYNNAWHKVSSPLSTSTRIQPELSYGLAKNLDIEYSFLYVFNQFQGQSANNLGDTNIQLGYQLLNQDKSHNHVPNLRFTLAETFPTGHYDRLSERNFGTGATGEGSYQTSIGLNAEYLSYFSPDHPFNAHACVSYNWPSTVSLTGFSIYGGNSQTRGYINPGESLGIDLAGELGLTRNWVAVMEAVFTYQKAANFRGNLGGTPEEVSNENRRHRGLGPRGDIIASHIIPSRLNIGNVIGAGNSDLLSLAPALEYNFSEDFGIIGGAWCTVLGKNNIHFNAVILELTKTWG